MSRTQDPNPVRTLQSTAVVENSPACPTNGEQTHEMISIKLGEASGVKYIERCVKCGWIDEASLNWWFENAIKQALPKRAQRIAVAASSESFAFVQSPHEELTLDEVLIQALAASQALGIQQGLNAVDAQRLTAIFIALRAEVMRFQRLAEARALREARQRFNEYADKTIIAGARVPAAGRLRQDILDLIK